MKEPVDSSYISWKKWEQDSFAEYSKEAACYFKKLFDLALPVPGKSVLEIGYGNGGGLGYLSSRGYCVSGIEMQEELVMRARANGYDVYHDVNEIDPERKFDLIVMIDVLEHIPQEEIPDFLSRLRTLLNSDGKILARFPNGDSPFGLKNQNGDVTHVTFIGSKKLIFGQTS